MNTGELYLDVKKRDSQGYFDVKTSPIGRVTNNEKWKGSRVEDNI